ncbi:MAG: peptide chain release factor N(5)-glutamine methyltransferase, partial [Firmicutes bacterium]|nr:peptide chain release factor N(5)-glutamine methyltransferase [Bacillota bacterium]
EKNNVSINFYNGNLFEPLNRKYDVIISNPPYIAYDEEIMDIVKNNEPNLALYAPNEGLYFYEEILKNVHKYINNNGLIAFEIGYNQGEKIRKLSEKYLKKYDFEIKKDMTGKDRMVFIKLYE